MRVLSIDPGSLLMGWAFFDGNKLSEYLPDRIVCEKYFAHSTKGANVIPEVRGIIRLVAATINIELEEVAYNTVQRVVTGKGNSGKDAVKNAVEDIYSIAIACFDHSDAISLGYTWLKLHGDQENSYEQ
jgi:Holliday junction resolvasome RuvABC endonuclease subunit